MCKYRKGQRTKAKVHFSPYNFSVSLSLNDGPKSSQWFIFLLLGLILLFSAIRIVLFLKLLWSYEALLLPTFDYKSEKFKRWWSSVKLDVWDIYLVMFVAKCRQCYADSTFVHASFSRYIMNWLFHVLSQSLWSIACIS